MAKLSDVLSLVNSLEEIELKSGKQIKNRFVDDESMFDIVAGTDTDLPNIDNKINFEELSDLMASLCINYNATRWYYTSDIYSLEEALKRLQELGYTEDEAIKACLIMNMQHLNPDGEDNYEVFKEKFLAMLEDNLEAENIKPETFESLKDFMSENDESLNDLYNNYIVKNKNLDYAHMAVVISAQLGSGLKGDTLDFLFDGHKKEYFSFKGDIESGRFENDDILADIMAV